MIQRFNKANLSLIVFLCLIMGHAAGQNINDYPSSSVPLSAPTAAALGKYADIPVSYHTGIPSITIDIHTIQEGPLSVPISLSYHSSGLKVMEQASWVGAGWSLNVNGVITRSAIKGAPDERVANYSGDEGEIHGYLASHSYYSYYQDAGYTPLDPILNYFNFGTGMEDGEPDMFVFNFMGYNGKFYFRADGTPVLVPQQDITIQRLERPATRDYLYGWIVTTPDGVKYYFGSTPDDNTDTDAIDHTDSYLTSGDGLNISKDASSWYLYKIESADGKFSIRYNYATEEYGYYTVSMSPVLQPGPASGGGGLGLVKNIVHGVRLQSITFTGGTVEFIPNSTEPRQDLSNTLTANDGENTSSLALKTIKISTSSACKSFDFSYFYFNNNDPLYGSYGTYPSQYNLHSDQKRLALRSVKENTCNASENADYTKSKPPYLFSYYEEDQVPRTLSLGIDHWGFSNGAKENKELIPPVSINGGFYLNEGRGADRNPQWPQMRAGSLKSIQYPSGGKSEMIYGPHKVYADHHTFTQVCATTELCGAQPISARGSTQQTSVSTKYAVSLGERTLMRFRTRTFNGGAGSLYLERVSSGGTVVVPYGPPNTGEWSESEPFYVDAGEYVFYCVAGGQQASHQGVQGELYRLDHTQQKEVVTVGGLRIESIVTTDGQTNTPLTTSFSYVSESNIEQGVLYSRPSYVALMRNERMQESGFLIEGSNGDGLTAAFSDGCFIAFAQNRLAYVLSPSSIHPMQTTQGSHIGYNQVKVTSPGGGYTVYLYASTINPLSQQDVCYRIIDNSTCDAFAPNYPAAPDPIDYTRGELRQMIVFDENNNRIKETQSITDYEEEPLGVTGIIVRPNMVGAYEFATEYEMRNFRKTKTSSLEFVYAQGSSTRRTGLLTETFFESPNHTFPTKTVVTEVTGGTDQFTINDLTRGRVLRENRRTYAGDIILPSCLPDNSPSTTLLSALQTERTNYSAERSGLTDPTDAYYAFTRHLKRVNDLWMTYANHQWAISHAPPCNLQPVGDLGAITALTRQNRVGSLVESSYWREGKFVGSVYVSYQNNGTFEAPLVYPKNTYVYNTAQPLTTFSALSYDDSNLIKDSHYTMEESYLYDQGNLAEVVKRDGVPTSYIWGYNNTLPVVKAVGVPFSVLFAAYQSANGDPVALRNQATLGKALISTYTFSPQVGMASETDPNGKTLQYEYDDLFRLRLNRDNQGYIMQKVDYFYRVNLH